ncbi:hypothetical protein CPC08DRAFT_715238 [Agrocybe pediades]|nr:hypothetical protein CPC08DRAFT_715238 [Agrocybe pediades]
MTAFKSLNSKEHIPTIHHPCLRRMSDRRYELLDPKTSQGTLSFDVEQVKEIVEMDHRLRNGSSITCVPAGYSEFAASFNAYASGYQRFATYSYSGGKISVCTDGKPVVWEHLLEEGSSKSRSKAASKGQSKEAGPSHISIIPTRLSASLRPEDLPLDPLLEHIHVAAGTTDELIAFWKERGAIEHQYASRLAKLAEKTMGQSEPSDLRNAIDGCRIEMAKQAMAHNTLAKQIAVYLESRCLKLQESQKAFFDNVFSPAMRRLRHESPTETESPREGIASEWRKEYKNIRRFLDTKRFGTALKEHRSRHSISSFGDIKPVLDLPELSYDRAKDWEELYTSCEQMEQERSGTIKDVLSAYTHALSGIQQSHDESYRMMVQTEDLFEPKEVVAAFTHTFRKQYAPQPIVVARNSLDLRPSNTDNGGKTSWRRSLSLSRPPPPPPLSLPRERTKGSGGLPPVASMPESSGSRMQEMSTSASVPTHVRPIDEGVRQEVRFLPSDSNNNAIGSYPTRPSTEASHTPSTSGGRPLSMQFPSSSLASSYNAPRRSNSVRPQGGRPQSPSASTTSSNRFRLPKLKFG